MYFLYPLFLERTEIGLGHGSVPAVSASAHSRLQSVRLAEAQSVVASVRRSLIRVDQDLALGPATLQGHQKGIDGQAPIQPLLHRPTNDPAREQVDDYRQVQPPLPGANVGCVRQPDLVRLCCGKFPLRTGAEPRAA